MESVYLVQHIHLLPSEEEDIKVIGIYRNRSEAIAAVNRLKGLPGFCELPNVVGPEASAEQQGFWVTEYQLGKDHWPEGYVTM